MAATTLSAAVDAYLAHRALHYAASAVQNEGFVIRRFLAWYGDVQIRSLRPLGRVREPGDDARVSASHRRRLRRLRSPQSFDAVTLPSRSRRPRAAR